MEKESDIGSVTVRMGRRVGGEFLGDRQRDEGVRPRHREREGEGDLTGEGGRSRQSEFRQKGLTKSEG